MDEGWSNDATDCARLTIEAICSTAGAPIGFAFEGVPIEISDVSCENGNGRIVGQCADFAFVADLAARSDGWVEGVVSVDGLEVLRFFLERPYEEFEFFPPGHSGEAPPMEAPGRMGKRLSWAQIRAEDWPSMARTGYLTVEAIER